MITFGGGGVCGCACSRRRLISATSIRLEYFVSEALTRDGSRRVFSLDLSSSRKYLVLYELI